jgi:hypothetical protein
MADPVKGRAAMTRRLGGVHKSPVAEAEVASQQAEIKYLLAYSPDLNPIEKMWRKLKQLLRGMKARTNEDLFLAVQTVLEQVSKNDAGGGSSPVDTHYIKIKML